MKVIVITSMLSTPNFPTSCSVPFFTRIIEGSRSSSGANERKIPQIILIYKKKEHLGNQGSYGWGGIFVDYARPSDRTVFSEKIRIDMNESMKFKVVGYSYSGTFHVTIFSEEKLEFHSALTDGLELKLPKGEYYLIAKATWDKKGDVSNMFHIELI